MTGSPELESRTTMVGRKRKEQPSADAAGPYAFEKRPKLNAASEEDGDDSMDSGEVFSLDSTSRRSSMMSASADHNQGEYVLDKHQRHNSKAPQAGEPDDTAIQTWLDSLSPRQRKNNNKVVDQLRSVPELFPRLDARCAHWMKTKKRTSLRHHVSRREAQTPAKSITQILLEISAGGEFSTQAHKALCAAIKGRKKAPACSPADRRGSNDSSNLQQIEANQTTRDARQRLDNTPNNLSTQEVDQSSPSSASEMEYDYRDYGELARKASSSMKPTMSGQKSTAVQLHELSDNDKLLQARYYGILDSESLVRCLTCGEEGHMGAACPKLHCQHCNAFAQHRSEFCPTFMKCEKCRKRGHSRGACKSARSVEAGGPDDPCDLCNGYGHAEEMCSWMYRTYRPTPDNIKKLPRAEIEGLTNCYNCASRRHWGDDCPELPDFIQPDGVWSEEYASLFILSDDESGQRSERAGKQIGRGGEGGRAQQHQLAMLDDSRD